MREYDAIVVGSGSGMLIAEEAASHGLKVALVDKGPLGGTCLNLGCIPSKILIFAADRIVEMQETKKLGIEAKIENVDFKFIMERMHKMIDENRNQIRNSIKESDDVDFYEGEGHFVEDRVLEINGEKLRGEKIFLASGSRPFIPPINGLDSIGYLTNETLLKLEESARYLDVAKGEAMAEKEGFAKVVVEKDSGKILGFHIIGPYAPELIQEVVNAMAYGGHVGEIGQGIHIHPALSELIPRTMGELTET